MPDERPHIRIPLPPPEWERYIEEERKRKKWEDGGKTSPTGSTTGSVIIIQI
tara:strand:+ start:782 stop:937 length:156 start_codon:yes stop_codon:yes gene_type:complete